jgi:hypothetical protein
MRLTLKEAAALTGLSQRQLRYRLRLGLRLGTQVEGRWLVDSAALEACPPNARFGVAAKQTDSSAQANDPVNPEGDRARNGTRTPTAVRPKAPATVPFPPAALPRPSATGPSVTEPSAPARRARRLRQATEAVLDATASQPERQRHSLAQLRAFQIGRPLLHGARQAFGSEHPIPMALHRMLTELAIGCHRFERSEKAAAYRAARDAASQAACECALEHGAPENRDPSNSAPCAELLHGIEQELKPALAGLLRRNTPRQSREQFGRDPYSREAHGREQF